MQKGYSLQFRIVISIIQIALMDQNPFTTNIQKCVVTTGQDHGLRPSHSRTRYYHLSRIYRRLWKSHRVLNEIYVLLCKHPPKLQCIFSAHHYLAVSLSCSVMKIGSNKKEVVGVSTGLKEGQTTQKLVTPTCQFLLH